jgi:hypothetical protein
MRESNDLLLSLADIEMTVIVKQDVIPLSKKRC